MRGRRVRTGWTTRPRWPTCWPRCSVPRRMPGRRVAVLTDGGGHGAVAADALAAAGLRDAGARPARVTRRGCARRCGRSATVTNPVDLAGAGEQRPDGLRARRSQALLAAERGRRRAADRLLRRLLHRAGRPRRARARRGRTRWPTRSRRRASRSSCRRSTRTAPRSQVLRAAGIPVHRDVDRACAVLAGLVERRPPASPRRASGGRAARHRHVVRRGAGAVRRRRRSPSRPPCTVTRRRRSWRRRSSRTGVPGRAQGDRAGCTSPTAAAWCSGSPTGTRSRAAYADLVARLDAAGRLGRGDGRPRRRRRADRRLRARPDASARSSWSGSAGSSPRCSATPRCALAPVVGRRGRRLLLSAAGRAAAARRPGPRAGRPRRAGRTWSPGSRALAAAHPELAELELNPVLAGPSGALALDARVVLGRSAGSTSRR